MKTTATNFKYIVDCYDNEIIYNPVHIICYNGKPITICEFDYILYLGKNKQLIISTKNPSIGYKRYIIDNFITVDPRVLLFIPKLRTYI